MHKRASTRPGPRPTRSTSDSPKRGSMAGDSEKPPGVSFPLVIRRLRRRPLAITGILALLTFVFVAYSTRSSSAAYFQQGWSLSPSSSYSADLDGYPKRYESAGDTYVELSPFEVPRRLEKLRNEQPTLRVAVLEHAGFHDEVIGAVLKTLEDIHMNYTVYRDDWRWGYEHVLEPFLPKLPKRINRGQFANHVKARRYDLVIHVSCDYSWRDRMPDYIGKVMLEAEYLHVICIQHELENLKSRERDVWASVVDENRFSLMTMSPHTTRHLERVVHKWAIQTGNITWGNVGVDTLVPVFPMDPATLQLDDDSKVRITQARDLNRRPSDIAILGNIHLHRRNYQGMINELYEAIEDDPETWGYMPLGPSETQYKSANNPSLPPFKLHLVGSLPSNTHLNIPRPIEHMVEIHSDLQYTDFYRLIASMDLIVPAFNDFVYLDLKLSSAIPAGIISKVPILSTPLLLSSYSFLRYPALILHPSGMTEISAIELLRKGVDPMAYLPQVPPALPPRDPSPGSGGSGGGSGSGGSWGHGYRDPRRTQHGSGVGAAPVEGKELDLRDTLTSHDEWDRYHQTLYDANAMMMRRLLLEIEDRRAAASAAVDAHGS